MNTLPVRHFLERNLPQFILLRLKALYYRNSLRNWGAADKREFDTLKKFIPHGGTCLDVGANIGLYSLIMSDLVGPEGRVYAFEPIPGTYKILLKNLKYKNCDNVTVLRLALSDDNRRVRMLIPSYEDGAPAHGEARIDNTVQEDAGIEVDSARLDDLIPSIDGDISLIKVDIEGHELNFFRGALSTLRSVRPAVYSEVSVDKEEIFKIFLELNYTPWLIRDNGSLLAADETSEGMNYLFVPGEQSSKLC